MATDPRRQTTEPQSRTRGRTRRRPDRQRDHQRDRQRDRQHERHRLKRPLDPVRSHTSILKIRLVAVRLQYLATGANVMLGAAQHHSHMILSRCVLSRLEALPCVLT